MLAERFLADGWQVIWLNPVVPGPVPRVLVEQRGDLLELRPSSPVPCSLRSTLALEPRHALGWASVAPLIRRTLRRHGIADPSALWFSHIKSVGLQGLFPGVPTVWHVTDDYAGMSRFPTAAARLCRAGFQAADRVVCVSSALRRAVVSTYEVPLERCSVLPHGVDAGRFLGRTGPDPFPGIARYRIVYVGNTRRMDIEAVARLVAHAPAHVVIIGEREPLGALAMDPGVSALGPLPPERVGEILPWCDAGLISYSARELVNAQLGNPMKAMEYAAAGLQILSPPLPAYEDIGLPVRLYDSVGGLLERAVERPPTEDEREALRDHARAHTWEARYRQALDLLAGLRGQT